MNALESKPCIRIAVQNLKELNFLKNLLKNNFNKDVVHKSFNRYCICFIHVTKETQAKISNLSPNNVSTEFMLSLSLESSQNYNSSVKCLNTHNYFCSKKLKWLFPSLLVQINILVHT